MYFRKSVWANGGDFNDPILFWYAKGVAELMMRPLNDKTGWRYLAAIHGEDFSQGGTSYWQQYGYYEPGEPLPSKDEQAIFWNQCQHQSWFFLPWHRGYLISLEANVRQAIVKLGGPSDWALPYWDYSASDAQARDLPPAFKATTLPDGTPNPLFIKQRYGAQVSPPTLPLPADDVSLKKLNIISFVGASAGGNPGFGGPETAFNHGGGASGGVESLPHNIVHVDVGQSAPNGDPGLMADPDLAGLDPIFYLHHANIDRLWSYWLSLGDGRANPADQSWLQGPIGRPFMMPMPDGESWRYAPKDVLSTEQLGYSYDPLSNGDVVPASHSIQRVSNLGLASVAKAAAMPTATPAKHAELLGANDNVVSLNQKAHSVVKLDKRMMARSAKSFTANLLTASNRSEPDRYFLNLESIRAKREGITIDVHLKLDGQEVLLESLGLFGIKDASRRDRAHGGNGLTLVLDVTEELDKLHLNQGIDNLSEVEVVLTPRNGQNAELSVERISLYRQ
ncbi:tyrosinase family protein [Pseudoalteromonas fenneropenaei]|uniref:Tyrosinase family protein n=1 Tax=Pseudoalteromonas fenneropenaei TaxID=1737459 RepID=A0ABV7CF08_9GAMM